MGKIQRNLIYNVLLSISQVLFPLLVFPYVSRVLGPEGIGAVSFVDSIVQWCILAAALGIPLYGVREIAKVKDDPKERSRVFSELLTLHLATSVFFSVLLMGCFHVVTPFANYHQLFWVGTCMLFVSACTVEWLFQGMSAFPYITMRTLLVRAITVIAVFWLVNDDGDTTLYYAITLLGTFINILSNGWYAKRFVRYSFHHLDLRRHFRPMFFIFSFAIVTSVYTLLDNMLLGLMTDEIQVGYYSTAVRLIKLVITVLVAISTVLVPNLSYTFSRGQQEESRYLLQRSFSLMVFVGVPAAVGLWVIAPNIIQLFAGNQFRPAVVALQLLAPTIVLIGLSNVFGMQVLNPTHNERLFFWAALVGMGVSLLTNVLLIPHFHYIGAAMAGLLTETAVCSLLAVFAGKVFPFQPDWLLVSKALLATSPMILLHWFAGQFRLTMMAETVVVVMFAIVSYALVQHFIWKNPLVSDMLRLVSFNYRHGGRQHEES